MTATTAITRSTTDALAAVAAGNGGTLTPEAVVAAAADPQSPLHPRFVWDDTEAARRYRLLQAASLIRAVVTVLPREHAEPVRVRAFVSLSADRKTPDTAGTYRPITHVLADPRLAEIALSDALAELRAIRIKHGHLTALAHVWDAVEAIEAPTTAVA